jgi:MSHA biogenesis protein MshL
MEEDKRPGAFGVLVHYRPQPEDEESKGTLSWLAPWWLAALAVLATVLIAGCGSTAPRKDERALLPEIRDALTPTPARPAPVPPSVQQALVPPPDLTLPQLSARPVEPRFDLNVVNLPVAQVFAALAKDTRYSMLVDPQLTGNVTVNLKDVTLIEALDTLRDMYGFEYRAQGTRIFVQPASMQTRVFQVNYLTASRAGRSDVRVTSGSISQSTTPAAGTTAASGGTAGPTTTSTAPESSRITTLNQNDLWAELQTALRLLIGAGDKPNDPRQVIVSPQSSVILVRALPRELRLVEEYLRASRLNVERQVMLEAKIVEVRLRDSTQTGVNWAAFRSHGSQNGSIGPINPNTNLSTTGPITSGPFGATPGTDVSLGSAATAGLFGLAFQTGNFAALLSFLETQGEVQVLSSPRIAALNNQKAVLKVGTDDFFVTSITTSTSSTATGNVVSPTITVQPFFSGIALDVTPQIDADANIILHVHPSVSAVSERVKQLNLGSLGNFTLPLASSTVSETDTIVRARDGHIVAIGGLMKVSKTSDRTQLPGAGDIPVAGHLFGSRSRENDKQELVILIKPTVIHSDAQADVVRDEALARIDALTPAGTGNATRTR